MSFTLLDNSVRCGSFARPPHLQDLTILQLFDLFISLKNKYINTSVRGNLMVPDIMLMCVYACVSVCVGVCVCVCGVVCLCEVVCV